VKKAECGDHQCSYFCVLFKLKSRSVIVPITTGELSVLFFSITEMEILLRIRFRIATMLSVFFPIAIVPTDTILRVRVRTWGPVKRYLRLWKTHFESSLRYGKFFAVYCDCISPLPHGEIRSFIDKWPILYYFCTRRL